MRRFGFGRLAPAVATAFLLVPLVASLASAHAQLDTPTPADKATVTQPVTVVGGTFVERVNPELAAASSSSSWAAARGHGWCQDPTNAKQMVATPATPLGSGSYVVQWTTVSLDDGELARGTWTFTVAVAPSAAATPSASPTPGSSATVAPSAAATVVPPIVFAPTPLPSATGDTTGSGSDVGGPDHRGANRAGRRRSLSPQPAQPPHDPDAPDVPDAAYDSDVIPRLAARLAGGLAVAMSLALVLPATVAAHALNPTYTSRLPLAVYVVGAATAVALSFAFVIVRDVRAAPPDLTSPGTLPPAWLRIGLRVIGLVGWLWIVARRIAGGAERRRRSRRSSCGSTAGSALRHHLRDHRAGLALPRPVLRRSTTSAAWILRALERPAAGIRRDYPSRLGTLARGAIGFAVVRLAGARHAGSGPTLLFVVLVGYTAYTLAMMAQFGRDDMALAMARRSRSGSGSSAGWPGSGWPDEDGPRPPALVRQRAARTGLDAAQTSALVGVRGVSILFDGLSQTQAWFDRLRRARRRRSRRCIAGWPGSLSWCCSRFAVGADASDVGAVGAGLAADRARAT